MGKSGVQDVPAAALSGTDQSSPRRTGRNKKGKEDEKETAAIGRPITTSNVNNNNNNNSNIMDEGAVTPPSVVSKRTSRMMSPMMTDDTTLGKSSADQNQMMTPKEDKKKNSKSTSSGGAGSSSSSKKKKKKADTVDHSNEKNEVMVGKITAPAIIDGKDSDVVATTDGSKRSRRSRSRSRSRSMSQDKSIQDVNMEEEEGMDQKTVPTRNVTKSDLNKDLSTPRLKRKKNKTVDNDETREMIHNGGSAKDTPVKAIAMAMSSPREDRVARRSRSRSRSHSRDDSSMVIDGNEGNSKKVRRVDDFRIKRKSLTDKVEHMEESTDEMDVVKENHPPLSHTKKELVPPNDPDTIKPTTDFYVHRLRNLNYMPSAVTAMASTTDCVDGYVAVAREDGTYELKMVSALEEYRKHHCPHVVTVSEFYAPNDTTVAQSLCWVPTTSNNNTDDNTNCCCLIAASPNGSLWVVDWKRSKICSVVSSGGGGIFDLTYCIPMSNENQSTGRTLPLVAAACQDGSVRIWRVQNTTTRSPKVDDSPVVTMPSAGAPILSLAWKCVGVDQVTETESSMTTTTFRTILFAAVADGTIRKYVIDLDQQTIGTESTTAAAGIGIPIAAQETNIHYKVRYQKAVLRMTVESQGRRTPTKVWTLAVLGEDSDLTGNGINGQMTLVAGNSLGHVQFWNAKTGTLEQTILQTSLKADVLKVVVNADGTKVFCSGVDSRVVCLERLPNDVPSMAQRPHAWKLTNAQRPHTHDVKALAIVSASCPPSDASTSSAPRRLQTLVSSGLDMKLCSYEVDSFAKKRPQIWYPWPSRTPISTTGHFTAPRASIDAPRLLSMRRRDCIELHQLQTLEFPRDEADNNSPSSLGEGGKQVGEHTPDHEKQVSVGEKACVDTLPNSKEINLSKTGIQMLAHESHKYTIQQHQSSLLVGKIQLGGTGNGSCMQTSQLSPCGKFLAVSNASSLFVFYLDRKALGQNSLVEVVPVKLKLPHALHNISATALQFWENTLFVGDAKRPQVHVVNLGWDTNREGHERDTGVGGMRMRTIPIPELHRNANLGMELPVHSIHVSRNGKFMVTMSHVRENALHIFERVDGDDQTCYKHYWTLPSLGDRPASMTLIQSNQIAVATYQSRVYIFDMIEKQLSPFSKRHGLPVENTQWTEDLLCRRDFPLQLMVNPRNRNQLIMASYGTFCVLNLEHAMPRFCRVIPEKHVRRRRRRKPLPSGEQEANEVTNNHWFQPRVTKKVEDEYDDELEGGEESGHGVEGGMMINAREKKMQVTRYIPMSKEELYARNCTICLHYNGILYMDYLGPEEMVVVEQPWLPIVSTFPDALQRRIYGFN